jgi:hypothetical protein
MSTPANPLTGSNSGQGFFGRIGAGLKAAATQAMTTRGASRWEMSCRDRAVEFASLLWHNSAVPVFLERFILPLCAGTVILLALTNPMKFDATQRVTGTAALLFVAYFVAHTVYKKPEPELFTADVVTALVGEGTVWGVFHSNTYVTPISAVLYLRITNLQDQAASLSALSIEIKWNKKWVQLRRIPVRTITPYLGSLNNARHISIAPDDINEILATKQVFSSKEGVTGTMLALSADPGISFAAGESASFKVTLEDALHRRIVIESQTTPTVDPYGGTSGDLAIQAFQDWADLTKLTMRRFLPVGK